MNDPTENLRNSLWNTTWQSKLETIAWGVTNRKWVCRFILPTSNKLKKLKERCRPLEPCFQIAYIQHRTRYSTIPNSIKFSVYTSSVPWFEPLASDPMSLAALFREFGPTMRTSWHRSTTIEVWFFLCCRASQPMTMRNWTICSSPTLTDVTTVKSCNIPLNLRPSSFQSDISWCITGYARCYVLLQLV